MDTRNMESLKDKLCKELDEIAMKGSIGTGDLEAVHKLTDTIKNIDKIIMLEDGGYSQAGNWEADMRGTYGHGSSYARTRDPMGRYSGTYTRNYSRGSLLEHLEDMMGEASNDREREELKRCIDHLR